MKIFTFLLTAIVLLLSVDSAAAIERNFSADAEVNFVTDYMFRGVNRYDGAAVQPSLMMGYETGPWGNIEAGLWSHFSTEDSSDAATEITEIDYRLYYVLPVEDFTLRVGSLWYSYPDDGDILENTAEYTVQLSHDCYLNPHIAFFHDYDEYDYQYYELGLHHRYEVPGFGRDFNVTPFVEVGFASSAEGVYEDNGLVQSTYGVSTEAELGIFSIIPQFAYTVGHDTAAADEFWFGVALGLSY